MSDIKIYNAPRSQIKGQEFIDAVKGKDFLFSLVTSYTETCEIPGITAAGADPDFLKFTPPADAEFLHYGFCKSIDVIPMTPDGKPTPALLTRAALESADIPHVVINAGSKIAPKLPYIETGLVPGKNIALEPGLEESAVRQALSSGREIGRKLASSTDCLIIGESIPGGTTTALAVLESCGVNNVGVSSSMPNNPVDLKFEIVAKARKRLKPPHSKDIRKILANVGDPMIPFVAGMLDSATDSTKVILAGGTQMSAVLAVARRLGYLQHNTALATTSYIIDDKSTSLPELVFSSSDSPILYINPKLEDSKFSGLRAYSEGFVKEGVGAGGSMIASMLKTGIDSQKLLELIDKEYQRVSSSK